MSTLRSQVSLANLADVSKARLERSGEISVIKKSTEPQVIEIDVAEGVQTIRIQVS